MSDHGLWIPQEAAALKSQVQIIIRGMYSNPPNHGACIVETTLTNQGLYTQWCKDIHTMSDRIIAMRKALLAALRAKGTPSPVKNQWRHITDQIGMFSYTGLTPEQVTYIQQKYHIYMLQSGRISMAGIRTANVGYLATAIDDAMRTVKSGGRL